jgi:hypothetical protein
VNLYGHLREEPEQLRGFATSGLSTDRVSPHKVKGNLDTHTHTNTKKKKKERKEKEKKRKRNLDFN